MFFVLEASWNVMAHTQKPDFVFLRNGRLHLNQRGCEFSRLLAGEVCGSAVVMLDTPCSEVVWRVLATHSIHHFPLHFLTHASPCAITFWQESTSEVRCRRNVWWFWPLIYMQCCACLCACLCLWITRCLLNWHQSYLYWRCFGLTCDRYVGLTL